MLSTKCFLCDKLCAHGKKDKSCVLIVEDDPLVAMLVEDAVEHAGFEPSGPACSVSAALQILSRCRPIAAILDYDLSGESAIPIARELKKLDIPFVWSTASEAAEAVLDGVRNVGKPILPRRVAEALRSILNRI